MQLNRTRKGIAALFSAIIVIDRRLYRAADGANAAYSSNDSQYSMCFGYGESEGRYRYCKKDSNNKNTIN